MSKGECSKDTKYERIEEREGQLREREREIGDRKVSQQTHIKEKVWYFKRKDT